MKEKTKLNYKNLILLTLPLLLCLGVAVSGGNKLGAVAANATLLQLNGFNVDRAALSSYPGEAYADLDKYISPEHYHDLGEFYSETFAENVAGVIYMGGNALTSSQSRKRQIYLSVPRMRTMAV
jgi:hypothetical protein